MAFEEVRKVLGGNGVGGGSHTDLKKREGVDCEVVL
jgi:hypothetical protein